MLLIARAIEGVGSACINVCGMSLIAHVRVSAEEEFLFLTNLSRSFIRKIISAPK